MLKIIMPLVLTLLLPTISMKHSWLHSTLTMFLISTVLIMNFQPSFYKYMLSWNFLFMDALSMPIIVLTLWIGSLMILSSYKIRMNSHNPNFFLLTIMVLSITLLIAFSSSNLLIFYMSFETALIPTLFMILMWGVQPERLQAASYFMLYTVTASLPLLFSLMMIYKYNNSLSMVMAFWKTPTTLSTDYYWWLMTILAFLVKMPMYTTHLWLPKAHVEAPVAGSMVLAAILLKLGSYGFIRLSEMFSFMNNQLLPAISAVSMMGTVITSFICTRQHDMKALIAYASVSHMGLLITAGLSSTIWGWQGALAMMISHGICSSAMFSSMNMIYETSNSRSLFMIKGLMTIIPSYSLWLFLILMANMAAPPTINLITEIILMATITSMSLKFTIILAMTAFLSAVYSLYLFSSSQHGSFPTHMNPINYMTSRNILILFLHTTPLFILSTRMDLITLWC